MTRTVTGSANWIRYVMKSWSLGKGVGFLSCWTFWLELFVFIVVILGEHDDHTCRGDLWSLGSVSLYKNNTVLIWPSLQSQVMQGPEEKRFSKCHASHVILKRDKFFSTLRDYHIWYFLTKFWGFLGNVTRPPAFWRVVQLFMTVTSYKAWRVGHISTVTLNLTCHSTTPSLMHHIWTSGHLDTNNAEYSPKLDCQEAKQPRNL